MPDYPEQHQFNISALNEIADTLAGGSAASRDEGNSTSVPLGSNGTYTGEWALNDSAHIAAGFFADQDGEFYIDISIDGGATVLFSRKYDVVGGEAGRFDAFVKASRSHRVRFINGPIAQSSLKVVTFTGNHLFPFAISERDEPVFIAYQKTNVSASTYAVLVDLSDRDSFPHNDIGRLNLFSTFFFVEKGNNTAGAIQLGVITRIDGTDADVSFVQGVSFNSADARSFARDRILTHPIRLGQSAGELTQASTQFKSVNIADINSATALDSPMGDDTVTPAVGDLVVLFSHTGGASYTGTVSIQYSGSSSTS